MTPYVAGAGRTRIPIRSLWFLLVYASDYVRKLQTEERERLLSGEHDNDLLTALAEVLAHRCERRMRAALAPGYRERRAPLRRVRGRIDHLRTEQTQSMRAGQVWCDFRELTMDLPRYRYMLMTLRKAAFLLDSEHVRNRCVQVAAALERQGVRPLDPPLHVLAREQYGRHDAEDLSLVRLCRLIRQMALPVHGDGRIELPKLDDSDAAQSTLRLLFQDAIRSFYTIHSPVLGFESVSGGARPWPAVIETQQQHVLPQLELDTLIDAAGRRIVVECKFGRVYETSFRSTKAILKPDYVRQIYAYCSAFDTVGREMQGVILAARDEGSPGPDVDLYVGDFPVRLRQIDLMQEPSQIRSALIRAVDPPPGPDGATVDRRASA